MGACTSVMNRLCASINVLDRYGVSMENPQLITHFVTARASSIGQPSQNHDIYHLLKHISLCEATDPRDLLFSKIGLLGTKYSFPVDYSASNTMSSVLTQFAQRIIEIDKDLRILFYACKLNTEEDNDLPSWVPNWERVPAYSFGPGFRFEKLHDDHKPQYWPTFQYQFSIEPKISSTPVLRIQGYCFARVENPVGNRSKIQFKLNDEMEVEGRANFIIQGDELWLLNNAAQLYVLRPNEVGGYVLVCGLDINVRDDGEPVDLIVGNDGLVYAELFKTSAQCRRERVNCIGMVEWIELV
jgi:hypothetical protein